MPRCPNLAILVTTTTVRQQTKPIALPLAHVCGVIMPLLKHLTLAGHPDQHACSQSDVFFSVPSHSYMYISTNYLVNFIHVCSSIQ